MANTCVSQNWLWDGSICGNLFITAVTFLSGVYPNILNFTRGARKQSLAVTCRRGCNTAEIDLKFLSECPFVKPARCWDMTKSSRWLQKIFGKREITSSMSGYFFWDRLIACHALDCAKTLSSWPMKEKFVLRMSLFLMNRLILYYNGEWHMREISTGNYSIHGVVISVTPSRPILTAPGHKVRIQMLTKPREQFRSCTWSDMRLSDWYTRNSLWIGTFWISQSQAENVEGG